MVKIPTATSTNQLSTQTTASPINDIGSLTKASQQLQRAGQVLDGVATEFRQLKTLREVSNATIQTNQQLGELEDEILSRPDLTEDMVAEFRKRSGDIVNSQLGTIGDERARLNAGVQFQGSALNRGFNIKREGRNADVKNAGTARDILTDQAIQESFKAGNPEQSSFIRSNLEIAYNNDVAVGLMTPQQKFDQLQAFDEAIRKGLPQFDLDKQVAAFGSAGAEAFIEDVQRGKYREINGKPGLTTQEEQTLINAATNRMEREKKIEKIKLEETQSENLTELIPRIVDPTSGLTATDIDILVLKKVLSDTDATVAKRVINGKKGINAVTDPFTYNKIMNMKIGIILKEDGSRFSTLELQREVLTNLERLDATTVKGLLKEFASIQDKGNEDIRKNALARIKDYSAENILGKFTIQTALGKGKGEAASLETEFHNQAIKEGATGQRLYAIANQIIISHQQGKDPNFDPDRFKGKAVGEHFEGENAVSLETGEVKTYFIQDGVGTWITTVPAGKLNLGG